jgi:hypothetical protein
MHDETLLRRKDAHSVQLCFIYIYSECEQSFLEVQEISAVI